MLVPADIADSSCILPAVADLNVFKKGSHYLCVNSAVPTWLVTNELGYILLSLCDGRRSIHDIQGTFSGTGIEADLDLLKTFYRDALAQGIFIEPASDQATSELAGNRGDVHISALHLHLTNKCNLSCSYCYRQSNPYLPIRHGADDFIQWLQQLKPYSTDDCTITFAGGEPLVFPEFEAVAVAIKVLGFSSFLMTNGILLRKHDIAFYRDSLDEIRVSLDGGDELTHGSTRGSGHFEKVVSNIHWLLDGGVIPNVQMTLTKRNMNSATLLRERLPREVNIRYTPMFPMGRADRERSVLAPDDFITPAEFFEFQNSLVDAEGKRTFNRHSEKSKKTGCFAGRSNISVDDNGDVYPCHLFHMDKFKMGNIFSNSVAEIMRCEQNSIFVKEMHVDNNNAVCKNCSVRYLCGGGCKANTLHATGDFHGRDSLCSFLKADIVSDLFQSYGL
jgi:radical SAM protein with 4Fe4S-binding SPASM domain